MRDACLRREMTLQGERAPVITTEPVHFTRSIRWSPRTPTRGCLLCRNGSSFDSLTLTAAPSHLYRASSFYHRHRSHGPQIFEQHEKVTVTTPAWQSRVLCTKRHQTAQQAVTLRVRRHWVQKESLHCSCVDRKTIS